MLPSARFLVDGDLLGLAALAVAGVGILAGGTLRRLRPARLWGPPAACLLGSAGFLAAASRLPAGLVVAGLILLAVSGAALVPGPGPHEDATRRRDGEASWLSSRPSSRPPVFSSTLSTNRRSFFKRGNAPSFSTSRTR